MGLLKLAPWQDAQLPLVSSAATSADGAGAGVGHGLEHVGRPVLLVEGAQIGHVLVAQRRGDGAHRRVLALALLVGRERDTMYLAPWPEIIGTLCTSGKLAW
jgi:hypothetical protein